MTLVLNEIHIINGLENTYMIAAADRRITYPDGRHKNWKKIFNIPYLHGAISYYGLAEFLPKGKKINWNFTNWLPTFISNNAKVDSVECFALNLRDELNKIVPPTYLKDNPSGFHICGYDNRGYPEFWSLTNIGKFSDYKYSNLKKAYQPPANELQGGYLQGIGWNGTDPLSVENKIVTYRNGDIRAHGVVFKKLDEIYNYLSQFGNFKKIEDLEQYKDFIKYKFKILAYIYKKMAKQKIIGGDIDVLLLKKPKNDN